MAPPAEPPPRDNASALARLWGFLRGLSPQSAEQSGDNLAHWREWILWVVYLAGAWVGTALYLATVPLLLRRGHTLVLMVDTLALAWCWFAILLRRRLGRVLRSLVALAMIYAIGAMVLASAGPVSGGLAWLFTFAVVTGILLGRLAAALAIALNAATLAVLGWALQNALLPWSGSVTTMDDQWLVAGLNFILLNTLVAVTVAALLKGIEKAMADQRAARHDLQQRTDQLNQANARMDSILRASPVGIGVVVERVLTMANPQLCQITGHPENELVGRPARILYPTQEEYEHVGREKYRQIAQGGTGTVETRWVRKDGAIRHILLSSTPIAADDLLAGVTFTALDITARKQVEEDLRARAEELAALNALGRDVATSLSLEHASRAALLGLRRTLRPDLAMLFLRQGDRLVLQDIQPPQAAADLAPLPEHQVGQCLCGLAISENRPVFSQDVRSDPRCVMEECRRAGFTSFAALPLRGGDEILGVVGLGSREARDFSLQAEFLETMTAQLSVALANARLFETVRQELAERERAQRQLKESQERFRALGDQSPLGISILDGQGRYQYLNPAFVAMFGYTLEDIPSGRRWFALAFPHEEARRKASDDWREDVRRHPAGHPHSRTYRVTCKDGGQKVILFRAVGLGSGGAFVIYEDIGERQAAEAALRASEQRYRELFDGIDDIIFTHDLRGRILSINQAVRRVMGYDPGELVGRSFSELMLPQYRQAYFNDYLPAVMARGQIEGLTKYLDKQGGVHYVEYRGHLTREEGGEPYVRGSARDVSDRIQAERELRRLEEQLFQSQKMEAVGVLAGGIAHDFNNVLQAISSYVQLMQNDPLAGETTRQRLEGIGRYIERAAGMIKRLMTLARKVETRLERVDLNREVRHVAGILEHTLPKMIAIGLELAPDLAPVSGDPGQIEQVLLNLATNAGQAMPGGGSLVFATANRDLSSEEVKPLPGLLPGPHVQLEVRDSGRGMDEETLSHIFEPFFTTKPLGEGTGLGLSTVYGIVANHGGQVTCRSRPGEGTAFTILLPARTPQEGEAAPPPLALPPNPGGSEAILVVDDEAAIRESCREALAALGYRVRAAASGEEALEVFRQDPAALGLVIMDLGMPGMGGLSSLLAMLELRPQAKIMVATGYADASVQEYASGRPNLAIIHKPYRLGDLTARVRALLDQ